MEIKTPFFRLTIVVSSTKVFLTFFKAVSKLAFSVTGKQWQKRKVSTKDSPIHAETRYSRLGDSNLKTGCSFAELRDATKQTTKVDSALHHRKSTCGKKEKK